MDPIESPPEAVRRIGLEMKRMEQKLAYRTRLIKRLQKRIHHQGQTIKRLYRVLDLAQIPHSAVWLSDEPITDLDQTLTAEVLATLKGET